MQEFISEDLVARGSQVFVEPMYLRVVGWTAKSGLRIFLSLMRNMGGTATDALPPFKKVVASLLSENYIRCPTGVTDHLRSPHRAVPWE